jgi:hypothetical protein
VTGEVRTVRQTNGLIVDDVLSICITASCWVEGKGFEATLIMLFGGDKAFEVVLYSRDDDALVVGDHDEQADDRAG